MNARISTLCPICNVGVDLESCLRVKACESLHLWGCPTCGTVVHSVVDIRLFSNWLAELNGSGLWPDSIPDDIGDVSATESS